MNAYLTLAEADILLAGNTTWTSLTNEQKQSHIDDANLYIDSTYLVIDPLDSADQYKPELKTSSQWLIEEDLISDIFGRQSSTGPLEEVEVRAGSTLSRRRYSTTGISAWQDPFPKVTALLKQIGIKLSQTASTVYLIRG